MRWTEETLNTERIDRKFDAWVLRKIDMLFAPFSRKQKEWEKESEKIRNDEKKTSDMLDKMFPTDGWDTVKVIIGLLTVPLLILWFYFN